MEHLSATPQALLVPVPADAPHHFSTATVVIGTRHLVTSWVEGRSAYRIGVLDLSTGEWRVVRGVRGTLRDALGLDHDRALLLTEFAIAEIDLEAAEIERQLTSGFGKQQTYLERAADDAVAVGSTSATMETLVSLSSLSPLRRRRRARMLVQTSGALRVLTSNEHLVVAATERRVSAPQHVLVRATADEAEIARIDAPIGVQSAHLVGGGVIAAAPDVGQTRALTALPGVADRAAGDPTLPLGELVDRANESTHRLLQARARTSPPRTVHRDHRLRSGDALVDITARRITLTNCVAELAETAHERPRIARVHVTDLELQSSSVSGAVLEDVTIDGLRSPEGSGFVFGCELHRVTLKGRMHGLILNPTLSHLDPVITERYAQWQRDRLQHPEWMLDLTDATGSITIRGYPSRFIRRNPERQVVVTAETARTSDWRSVDTGRSSLHVELDQLEQSDWEDVVLVADTHGAHAADDRRYLQRLRDAGIAEQE